VPTDAEKREWLADAVRIHGGIAIERDDERIERLRALARARGVAARQEATHLFPRMSSDRLDRLFGYAQTLDDTDARPLVSPRSDEPDTARRPLRPESPPRSLQRRSRVEAEEHAATVAYGIVAALVFGAVLVAGSGVSAAAVFGIVTFLVLAKGFAERRAILARARRRRRHY
jgi:hypothetical protein